MRKFRRQIRGCISGLLFIGMSVQIVLGLTWMLANFAGFQEFGDSYGLVDISKSLLCDEYTGILYPVLIMLARGVAGILPVPYYSVLYLVQIMVAVYASHRFLWAVRATERPGGSRDRSLTAAALGGEHRSEGSLEVPGGKGHGARLFWDIWGTLCLVSIPVAMQCHLAVLPNSLTLSCNLVMMSYVLESAGRPVEFRARSLVKMMPLWLAASLLTPEYRYLAAVPIACLFGYTCFELWKGRKKQILYNAVVFVAFVGIILAVGSLTQVPGSYGKMRKTVSASAVSRFVWPWFLDNYDFWPEEIRNIMTIEDAREISWYADRVRTQFGPMVENAVGLEKAGELYRQMAGNSFDIHTKDIIGAMTYDAMAYTLSPVFLQESLNGRGGNSFSGRNYEIMKARTPGLTRNFVRYGSWWFLIGILLGAAGFAVRSLGNKLDRLGPAVLLIVSCLAMVVYYTLCGAGVMDYKNTVFVVILWYAWMMRYGVTR